MREIETPVLIVGGAGCGLASAIFLSELGIDSWLIERHASTSPAPKAHYINPRTMELFREVGLADRIYLVGAPLENMQRVGWYTSLGGDGPLDRKTIAQMDSFGGGSLKAAYEKCSPCRATNYPQLRLEPLMHDHASSLPHAHLNYHHELVSFEQDAGGVAATILNRDDDTQYRVRAKYMIGADGGRKVGPDLGVVMDGPERLIDMMSAHFIADLSPWIDDDTPMIRWFNNPDAIGGTWGSGVIVAMGPESYDRHSREWLVHFSFAPDDPAQFSQETIVPRLRELLKIPGLDLEVVRMNNWQVQGVLAQQFKYGRIFLAGDAAHRHPPTTGLGLNSAIQDAHNLAWKLAAVLNGGAGEGLLETYEAERRAATGHNVEWALFSFQNHLVIDAAIGLIPGAPMEVNQGAYHLLFSDTPIGRSRRQRLAEVVNTQRMEFQAQEIEMGYAYASEAIIADGTAPPETDPMGGHYVQTARPGHRAPHVWLDRGGERVSTLDLYGNGKFALLAGPSGTAWCEAATALAQDEGHHINVHRIGQGGDLTDPSGEWLKIAEIEADGAVLVRPDGHVCWRSTNAQEGSAKILGSVMAQVLDRAPRYPIPRDGSVRRNAPGGELSG